MEAEAHTAPFAPFDPQQDETEDEAPLVFQCRKCLVVIGDSSNLIMSDEACLVLSGVSSTVAQSRGSQTPNSIVKVDLFCINCRVKVGTATKSVKDDASRREHWAYKIDISAITSYQLGYSEDPFSKPLKTKPVPNSAPVMDADRLSEQILKIEKVILLFNERIMSIENVLSQHSLVRQNDTLQDDSSVKSKDVTKRAKKARTGSSISTPSGATLGEGKDDELDADPNLSAKLKR